MFSFNLLHMHIVCPLNITFVLKPVTYSPTGSMLTSPGKLNHKVKLLDDIPKPNQNAPNAS